MSNVSLFLWFRRSGDMKLNSVWGDDSYTLFFRLNGVRFENIYATLYVVVLARNKVTGEKKKG